MRPVKQVSKKIKTIFLYLIYYLLSSLIVVILFGVIYLMKAVNSPWKVSFEIFWNIENYRYENIIYWTYAERIVNELFSVILVGTVLAHLLQPLNPILFCKYAAHDTVDRKMVFKYWIMLPKDHYLYDVKINLVLADYAAHQQGINRINAAWEIEDDKERFNFNIARGIRYVELTEKESNNLIKAINNLLYEHKDNKKYADGIGIDLYIKGTSERGITYHGLHKYKLKDILLGYRHVPLQRHSYDSEDFYRESYLSDEQKRNINASEDFYQSGKKEFFRYQHFDKVYKLKSSAKAEKAAKNHDILTKNQIKDGQYRGLHQFFLDLISLISWYFLDSNKKIKKVIRKASEYFLYITRIRRF